MAKQIFHNFEWQVPRVIATLPKGKDAGKVYRAYQVFLKRFPNTGWIRLKYNEDTDEIYHSNNIDAGIINKVLRNSGIRVAVPADDFNRDILRLIQGKHYADFNALVCQQTQPSFEKNNGLWRKVIELAEKTPESIKYPFMIQGFYNLPDKTENGYGIKIVSAPNFAIIEDDRLSGKYNQWKFDKVDEKGLPVGLDKSKGSRTFYTRNDGLSRVYLGRVGNLYARGDILADSNDLGRVVFVKDAEGVASENC